LQKNRYTEAMPESLPLAVLQRSFRRYARR